MKTLVKLLLLVLVMAPIALPAQLPGRPKLAVPSKEADAGLTSAQVESFIKFHKGMESLTPEEKAFFKDPANLKNTDAVTYVKISKIAADAGLDNMAQAHSIMGKTTKAFGALQTEKTNKVGMKVKTGVPDSDINAVRPHEKELDQVLKDYTDKK